MRRLRQDVDCIGVLSENPGVAPELLDELVCTGRYEARHYAVTNPRALPKTLRRQARDPERLSSRKALRRVS